MKIRDENREWMTKESERFPEGWEARMIAAFGIEGALDLLAAQDGRPSEINLTHRPFAGNPELKARVREARAANHELGRAAYMAWWAVS